MGLGSGTDPLYRRGEHKEMKPPGMISVMGFPGSGSAVRNCLQCGRHRRRGFDPWAWKMPRRRAWQPTPVFLPGASHGLSSLVGYSPWAHKRVRHDWSKWASTHRYLCWGTLPHFQLFKSVSFFLSLSLRNILLFLKPLFKNKVNCYVSSLEEWWCRKGHCVDVNHFFLKKDFCLCDVQPFWSLYWMCYNVASVWYFGLFWPHRMRDFRSPDPGLNLHLLHGKVMSYSPKVNCLFVFFSPSSSPSFAKASTSLTSVGALAFFCSFNLSPQAGVHTGWPWSSWLFPSGPCSCSSPECRPVLAFINLCWLPPAAFNKSPQALA